MKTKEYATSLREQGLGYAEVAEQTGYSIDWCKKNLKTVQKNRQEKGVIDDAIGKAQSQDGITNGGIKYLVRSLYPVDGTKAQQELEAKAMSRFKTAINKTPNTIIRPYWMQPENAQVAFNIVLSSVDIVQQKITELVDDMRQQLHLDISYDNSIRYAIIKMLQGSTLAQEGIENHCDYLSKVAYTLQDRNTVCTEYAPINTCMKKCALKKPDGKSAFDDSLITLDDLPEGW